MNGKRIPENQEITLSVQVKPVEVEPLLLVMNTYIQSLLRLHHGDASFTWEHPVLAHLSSLRDKFQVFQEHNLIRGAQHVLAVTHQERLNLQAAIIIYRWSIENGYWTTPSEDTLKQVDAFDVTIQKGYAVAEGRSIC